jgi:HEAT repeat protein
MASGGDRPSARRMLSELLTSSEQYIRQTAQRDLLKLDALDTIDRLNVVLEEFNQKNGRYPTDLDELVRARVLASLPVDPTGEPFAYDPITHAISLSPTSKIGALPKKMNAR